MLPKVSFPLSAASLLDAFSSILSNMLPIQQRKEENYKKLNGSKKQNDEDPHLNFQKENIARE